MKRPFLVFLTIVSVLLASALWFIQSARFAQLFKNAVAKYLPADLGIDMDFSEFAIKMYPPGLSLRNPEIILRSHNIAQLPPGSMVRAERIDFNFTPFQVFSGHIRVHEVVIVRGEVRLLLDEASLKSKPVKKSTPFEFHWDELLQVRAEAVALQDTKFHLEVNGTDRRLDFLAQRLRLGQWTGKGGLGYEVLVALRDFRMEGFLRNFPTGAAGSSAVELASADASVHLNSLGAEIDSISLAREGVSVKASGRVQGNLLNPKTLLLDAGVEASADLQRLIPLLTRNPAQATGQVIFEGRVRGDLERVTETLRAEGKVKATQVRYDHWDADRVEGEGSYAASPKGGELRVAHAVLEGEERERELAPVQVPGRGGQVELRDLRVRLGEPEPITAELTLQRAHLHWLAAPVLKDVFPLGLRATGPVSATYTPPPAPGKPWGLKAKLNLAVENFTLDNQKWGVSKPLHRVLKVPRLQVEGGVTVDPTALRPENLTLTLPSSKFRLEGKIDFKQGYDLYGGGITKLEDIGEIAENQIRGEGGLNVRVHGPSSAVLLDFDVDLQNAYYLKLKLGALKGRITWEDGPDHLVFKHLSLLKGRTQYEAEGMLDLGKADSIALNVQVPEGNIGDLIGIFEETTDKIWWFPRTLNGSVSGEIQVLGGIGLDRLEVLADLSGNGWEYAGERFETVSLQGGYDKGRYQVTSFKGLKRTGRVFGHISLETDERMAWELQTQQLTVNDLDHVARLDVPIRGKLAIESSGRGRIGAIQSQTRIFLTDLAVRGVAMPPSQFLMKSEQGLTEIRASALGGQGVFELDYDSHEGAASRMRAETRHLDFSPVLLLLNPSAIPDTSLVGVISGAATLGFRSGKSERGSGNVEVSEYVLAKSGTSFRLAHPVSFRVTDGSFDVRDLGIIGGAGGGGREVAINLRSRQGALQGTVSGDADLSVLEFLTSSVAKASGGAALDFAIGGTIKAPEFSGKAVLDGANLRVPSVESTFENITGTLQLRQNVLLVQNLESELAGGRVSADGAVTLFADRYPALALKAQLTGSKLKVYPFQFVKTRGTIKVSGDRLPYLVEGKLAIDSALSREKIFTQKTAGGAGAVQYLPPPATHRMADVSKFSLRIEANADGGILVQNELLDLEAKAAVTIVNTLEAPRILGTAEVVQGQVLFKDRVFRIQNGELEFDNRTSINPKFTLTANTDVGGTKVLLNAQGRLDDQWKVAFSSTPVMGESEILSLLTTGMSAQDTKRLNAVDRSAFEQGEAASLVLHTLDFNREFESKTGVQIQLDETVNSQLGTSVVRPTTPMDTAASPKIVIKKRINKDLNVSVGSTVGVGSASQKEVNAEVKVTPGFSVNGVYDYLENDTALGTKSSYGLDLKLEKRFK